MVAETHGRGCRKSSYSTVTDGVVQFTKATASFPLLTVSVSASPFSSKSSSSSFSSSFHHRPLLFPLRPPRPCAVAGRRLAHWLASAASLNQISSVKAIAK